MPNGMKRHFSATEIRNTGQWPYQAAIRRVRLSAKKMTDEAQRKLALDHIRQNIESHGFHTYGVTGGGIPHYAYTIGLSRSHGVELILAGSYYYSLQDVPEIVKRIAREFGPPAMPQARPFDLGSYGCFSLRTAHTSWVKALLLGALDFYQVSDIPALQIVPDAAHGTIDVPNLSEPWSTTTAPAWQWLHEPWTYPIPLKAMGITNLAALQGEPITEVLRWEEDEWELFAGAGPDVPKDELRVVPLGVLLTADLSLKPIVDLGVGEGLWRDEAGAEWHPWLNRNEQKPAGSEE